LLTQYILHASHQITHSRAPQASHSTPHHQPHHSGAAHYNQHQHSGHHRQGSAGSAGSADLEMDLGFGNEVFFDDYLGEGLASR